MYYTSEDKADCLAYNEAVKAVKNYNGVTTDWANVIEHKGGGMFAIMACPGVDSTMQTLESLDGWFETELM